MEILEALKQTFMDPSMFWGRFTSFLPSLIAAAVLLIIGHVVGRLVASVVTRLLQRFRLDSISAESFQSQIRELREALKKKLD